jgi:hypothetical protein
MNKPLAVQTEGRKIARPLKVLVPLIQSELHKGNTAGREHYCNAGNMLIEAKESEQVPVRGWSRWLGKNFDLSQRRAQELMQWAREAQKRGGSAHMPDSMAAFTGHTERRREDRQSKQQQAYREALRDVFSHRDEFAQERQAREQEVRLHRELAEQLVDAGYRALATRFHPDRGGSKDAMARLNRVRDELKSIAQSRRFV